MSLEALGIIVAVVFGILAIVVAYSEGRTWLKKQIGKLATAWYKIVTLLVGLRNRSVELIKDTLASPLKLTLLCTLILLLTHILIAWLNTSITIRGVTFSSTVTDAIVGAVFSLILLSIVVLSLRFASKGPAAYMALREKLIITEAKLEQLQNTSKKAEADYQTKISDYEVTLARERNYTARLQTLMAYLKDQEIPIPENAMDIVDSLSRKTFFQLLDNAVADLPQELWRNRNLLGGSRDPDWDCYGSGDYGTSKILKVVNDLGPDVNCYVRLQHIILVRNRVFATFTRKEDYKPPSTILVPSLKPYGHHFRADFYVHRTNLLDEFKHRNGVKIVSESDLPLQILTNALEGNELQDLLTEAYYSA